MAVGVHVAGDLQGAGADLPTDRVAVVEGRRDGPEQLGGAEQRVLAERAREVLRDPFAQHGRDRAQDRDVVTAVSVGPGLGVAQRFFP